MIFTLPTGSISHAFFKRLAARLVVVEAEIDFLERAELVEVLQDGLLDGACAVRQGAPMVLAVECFTERHHVDFALGDAHAAAIGGPQPRANDPRVLRCGT
jgi:hypothetical protein